MARLGLASVQQFIVEELAALVHLVAQAVAAAARRGRTEQEKMEETPIPLQAVEEAAQTAEVHRLALLQAAS